MTALLTCLAIASPLAGCGGSQRSGAGLDPAQAVPASAPIYAGAVVRPSGALQANARSAAQAFTHQADPYARLLGALQTPGAPALSFKRDLDGWLGTQAGIFLSSPPAGGRLNAGSLLSLLQGVLSGSGSATFPFAAGATAGANAAQGAFVLEVRSSSAARAFLNAQASRAGARAASYGGASYQVTSAGVAFGLVGRFALIGTETALHGAIDTARGGASLRSAPPYSSLRAIAPANALAHVYMSATGARARNSSGLLAQLAGAGPTNISLLPSSGSIALDSDTLVSSAAAAAGGLLWPEGEAPRALGELPSDSFVGFGFGSSEALSHYIQALRSLLSLRGQASSGLEGTTAGLSIKSLLGAILQPADAMTEASAEARRDYQSWMGPGAVFASGTSLADLRAGVVIWSKNPALSRAAVAKLASNLRRAGASVQPASIPGTDAAVSVNLTSLPVALDIADVRDAKGQTKFVIGIGPTSVAAAIGSSAPLSSATSYGGASSALGEGIQPAIIVQFPTLLSLLEGAGLGEDPSIAPSLPYLRSLTTVAAGTRSLGSGADRLRLVLELRAR
jgi:hypothetical protein